MKSVLKRVYFTYFGVDVSAHCLWDPGLLVELGPSLLLGVSGHVRHQLIKQKDTNERKEKVSFLNTEIMQLYRLWKWENTLLQFVPT